MYARTSTWSGSPEALQRWADHTETTVRAFIERLPGNVGATFLIDRDAGVAMTLTVWESEDAAAATDLFAEQSRSSTVAAPGTELVARGQYEVLTPS